MLEKISIKDYEIVSKLTLGENSIIYKIKKPNTESELILKLNIYKKINPFKNNIMYESEILQIMSETEGFPKLIQSGKKQNISYSIIPKFGPSLENLKQICLNKFSLKTTLLIFDQMLLRIEDFHKKGLVHCYLTPDHFLIGTKKKSDTIYLISFDKTKIKKSCYRSKNMKTEINFLFMSVNQLEGGYLSWKDDLESLCYIIIYFLNGELPWSKKFIEEFEKHQKSICLEIDNKIEVEIKRNSFALNSSKSFAKNSSGSFKKNGSGSFTKNNNIEKIHEKENKNEKNEKINKENNRENLLEDIKFEILKIKRSITLEELTKGLPGKIKRRNFRNFKIL